MFQCRQGKVCKECMEGIMNEQSDWDHNVEGDAVKGPGQSAKENIAM